MNAAETRTSASNAAPSILDAAKQACGRIAPSWPLDQLIAVNPYWGYIDTPFHTVAARLSALANVHLFPERNEYQAHFRRGDLKEHHLEQAIAELEVNISVPDVIAAMHTQAPPAEKRSLITDVIDGARDNSHRMTAADFVTHHVSQFCGSYFDQGQARFRALPNTSLYSSWRTCARSDLSPSLLLGVRKLTRAFAAMPDDASQLICEATHALGVEPGEQEDYFTSLLLSINGWAAWCAYLGWQASLHEQPQDTHLIELLAIRLAWEWALYQCCDSPSVIEAWRLAKSHWPRANIRAEATWARDRVLQRALEIAFQTPLIQGLLAHPIAKPLPAPRVQAVFCIDVRSEVYRRALEASSQNVQTLGFAGFFGLPIAYTPFGTTLTRSQLPGLLAPRLHVGEQPFEPDQQTAPTSLNTNDLAQNRQRKLALRQQLSRFSSAATSAFSFVETSGIFYTFKLLAESMGLGAGASDVARAGLTKAQAAALKPCITHTIEGHPVELGAKIELAHGVLRAMSLTKDFARCVLLVGHGSATQNNPQASSLDCGACCGQSGEINARVLAALLNEPNVRQGLVARGVPLTPQTQFIAGLHNTTTDDITLFDLDTLAASHAADVQELKALLDTASARARTERAHTLGLGTLAPGNLSKAFNARARDWSEVRPEWGLAGNAAFIVAPRARSQHLNLEGRVFLHDYDFQSDTDSSILELIMTAPMIVTHWINMQYYASRVDNARFGSGNKVLHNVVGANIGVFEGNGGDLRIGLAKQSLHDGQDWVHTPLRLSVFIDAPINAISAIVEKHTTVKQLVENRWIYLFHIDRANNRINQTEI